MNQTIYSSNEGSRRKAPLNRMIRAARTVEQRDTTVIEPAGMTLEGLRNTLFSSFPAKELEAATASGRFRGLLERANLRMG